MSCWVAPTVAADVWGVSLEEILTGIKDGRIVSRSQGDFLFVDVDSQKSHPNNPVPRPTFTVVSDEELAALAAEEPIASEPMAQGDDDELEPEDEIGRSSRANFTWASIMQTRQKLGRTRRPPVSQALRVA